MKLNSDNLNEAKLEAILHRQLRQLPDLRAPQTLAPRVMAAIQAKARLAWWRQPFWSWPLLARVGLESLATVGIGLLLWLGWMLQGTAIGPVAAPPSGKLFMALQSVLELATILGNAMLVIGRSGLQPWLLVGLGMTMLMYLLCLGAGTTLVRVAYRRG
jgi:uncharacterized membrane protein